METIIERIQSPETEFGKNFRDGFIVALSVGGVAFFESLDKIDFGQYEVIVASVIGYLIAMINRYTRK